LVGVGDEFENAVAAVMYQARTLVSQSKATSYQWDKEMATLSGEVKPEWMENWYDGLGFCTCLVLHPVSDAANHEKALGMHWARS
jgi:hypothetical protein